MHGRVCDHVSTVHEDSMQPAAARDQTLVKAEHMYDHAPHMFVSTHATMYLYRIALLLQTRIGQAMLLVQTVSARSMAARGKGSSRTVSLLPEPGQGKTWTAYR